MKIQSKEERITQIIAHVVMSIFSILAVLPFWLLIAASFTEEKTAIREGYKFIPSEFSLDAYSYIFKQWSQIGSSYGITIMVTVIGTALSILLISMFAYGLIHKDIAGMKVILFLTLLTMLFNGGIVPTYIVYTNIFNLKNTIWALIIPNLLMNGFTVILVKNYFQQNIPKELLEAAEIDGAGQYNIFFKIVMPLSTPILATIGLLNAVSYWNDWTNGLYYINNTKLYSIQQLLNEMNNNIQYLANNASNLQGANLSSLPSNTVRMAIAVMAILPIIIIYPFFQKYFARGITAGAVKG